MTPLHTQTPPDVEKHPHTVTSPHGERQEERMLMHLKFFDFRLWFAFLLILLIPSVINIVRLHFIGAMPDVWSFSIAAQMQWLGIVFEIIREAALLPLFFMLSQAAQSSEQRLVNNTLTGLAVVFMLNLLAAALVWIFAGTLSASVGLNTDLALAAAAYVRLESVGIVLTVVVDFLLVYLAVIDDYRRIIALSLLKTVLLLAADVLLVSPASFSLKLGINGIAYSNIAIHALLVAWVLYHPDIRRFIAGNRLHWDWLWLKQWFRLGAFSGIESLIRNSVFVLMIVRMMNGIGESGSYWAANSVIWGVLLLPSLALAEVVKRDTAANAQTIRTHTPIYLMLTAVFALLWLCSMPAWHWLLPGILGLRQTDAVMDIMTLQTPFYLLFMLNNGVLDATIKGRGKTKYMMYQSLFIDVGYYGMVFALYSAGILAISLTTITLVFGMGMALDLIPTLYFYRKIVKATPV